MDGRNYYAPGQWNLLCSCCGEEKHIKDFYVHSNGKPRKQCKVCVHTNRKVVPKEKRKLYAKKYRDANYEKCLEFTRQWRKANLKYDAYRAKVYRTRKQNQLPSWANLDKIKEIYLTCPIGYHVDHIIPLKGTHACGLHVETNLQHLPAAENLKKRNLYGWE
jgi:hypothetical protein